jgi:hypothetical protein
LALLIAPLSIALLAILCYLSLKSQPITYYYFKFQTVILILLLPFLLLFISKLIFESRKQTFMNQLVSLLVLAAVVGLSIPSIVGYDLFNMVINRTAEGNPYISDRDAEMLISESLDSSFSANNPRIFYFYPEQLDRTILASNMARSSYASSTCDAELFRNLLLFDAADLGDAIKQCVSETPQVIIHTDEEGLPQLMQNLPEQLISDKEVVITAE